MNLALLPLTLASAAAGGLPQSPDRGPADFVDAAGDVNLDGYDDVIVGVWEGSASDPGHATVFSGRTGETLHTIVGDEAGDGFATAVAGVGDVDGDGAGDFAIGAPLHARGQGAVWVYSGRKGRLLHLIEGLRPDELFGAAVSGAGDVDSDGFGDVVVGAPGADGGKGAVRVLSGKDAELLHAWEGRASGDLFGHSVDGAGDVDGDEAADVIVGALGGGYAIVFDGLDGEILFELSPPQPEPGFGWVVAGAGDVDQTGLADVLVTAPFGPTAAVYVYAGSDGELLHVLASGGEHGAAFGWAADGVGDVDGDGFDDFAVADPALSDEAAQLGGRPGSGELAASAGVVRIFSGHEARPLFVLQGETGSSGFGLDVSGAGDVDQDGLADVAVGAPFVGVPTVRVAKGPGGDLVRVLENEPPRQVGKGQSGKRAQQRGSSRDQDDS